MDFDKAAVDTIMEKLHIQCVGNGYVDMICPTQNIGEFIDYMEELGITIKGFAWCCHVRDGHQSCGLGGPRNQ